MAKKRKKVRRVVSRTVRPTKPVRVGSTCNPCGLNASKFGLALGIICGLAMLIVGLTATYAGYGVAIVELCSSLYIGYDITLVGSIVGGIWGFFYGAILGGFFAIVHNRIAAR